MVTFPTLRTGAVIQYPASHSIRFETHVTRFLDGSEQRFRDRRRTLRWVIRLEMLDEQEAAKIETFFTAQQGQYGSFEFVDPWTGTAHPDCSFEQDSFEQIQTQHERVSTLLVVKENSP
jgi:hypothetical protein